MKKSTILFILSYMLITVLLFSAGIAFSTPRHSRMSKVYKRTYDCTQVGVSKVRPFSNNN